MKKDANRLFNEFKKEIKTHAPELLKQLGINSSRSYSSLAKLGAENAAKAIDDKIKKQLPNANIGPVKVVDYGGGDFKLKLPNIHYKKLFSWGISFFKENLFSTYNIKTIRFSLEC